MSSSCRIPSKCLQRSRRQATIAQAMCSSRSAIGNFYTLNGRSFLTTNSSRHGSTAFQLPAVTGSQGASTLGYSRTLGITPKSLSLAVTLIACRTHFIDDRILLASIRNLGLCPCPHCFIPLSRVHHIGMRRDMTQRVSLARIDDAQRQVKVTTARRLIYEKQHRINSAAIENLLKEESWVPTLVRS